MKNKNLKKTFKKTHISENKFEKTILYVRTQPFTKHNITDSHGESLNYHTTL